MSMRLSATVLTVVLLLLFGSGCGGQPGGGSLPREADARLKELGVDLDGWRAGGWRNWNPAAWLRGAEEFVNPVIDGLWGHDRMAGAREPYKNVPGNVGRETGVSDPEPAPVAARPVQTPYRASAAAVGKVFFDGPAGPMVCSATVVQDPARPGRSNLVWTAGHCVHAGRDGGWFRNIVFVPSYNDTGAPAGRLGALGSEQLAPFGMWWADGAAASDQWIAQGRTTGGDGAAFDYAVLHVAPEGGGDGRSLEETVGSALPIRFSGPAAPGIDVMGAWGYPAAAPFDGARMHSCTGRPGRLSLAPSQPTMYRIGCTMTGGSSGGGWFAPGADGRPALVSNTSIGPVPAAWLAGPFLGAEAQAMFAGFSRAFAAQPTP
ncbi:trypsin-like serine peptidase [Streptomyces sp. PR69]|uniref:trypsin-like serine peptidase n=1 Tax=Streptomyces sp. PR69 TaxID=2984950 RepID=UPI00226445E3|nr:hypothetical protein [Streptomyces sp. PR69]